MGQLTTKYHVSPKSIQCIPPSSRVVTIGQPSTGYYNKYALFTFFLSTCWPFIWRCDELCILFYSAFIFRQSKETTEEAAQRLNIPFCYANMSEAMEHLLGQFRWAKVCTIIATPILSVALNVPDVNWVIHFDYSYSMMGYIQEAGRAGRNNGSTAFSFVITPIDGWLPKGPNPDCFGTRLIQDSLNNKTLCHWWMMQMFNEGVGEPCSMMDGVSHFCDNCWCVSSVLPKRGGPKWISIRYGEPAFTYCFW